MGDSTGMNGCGCGGSNRDNGVGKVSVTPTETAGKVLQARIAQAYDAKFNVRIVPGRGLLDSSDIRPRCRPRGNSPGWTGPGISSSLLDALAKADGALMRWLARDKANAQRFLADPLAALREANVSLDRAQLKDLARARAAAETSQLVPPGVTVQELTAEAFPNGRVGGINQPQPGVPGGTVSSVIYCSPKRKG